MKVTLIGDWAKTTRLIGSLDRNIKEASIKAQRKIADRYVRLVKAHLRNQDIPGWTPLNPAYADYKMGKYGHEDILLRTYLMYDSIESWRSHNVYFAGIKKGHRYKSGVEVARVAEIHEIWSTVPGKPHRPLWSYTWRKDMGGNKGVREDFIEEIKNRLKQKGYPVRRLRF
jgi:hypothetical protein